jgi:hypothetical protein
MAGRKSMIRRAARAAAVVMVAGLLLVQCEIAVLRSSIESQVAAAKQRGTVEPPVFTPTEGTYSTDQAVVISSSTAEASIYYTTDGSTPTHSTTKYSGPISVAGDGTTVIIKAIAAKEGMNDSVMAKATFVIDYDRVSTPQFTPPADTYTTDQTIAITTSTTAATIYYTTDGSDPTTSSTRSVYGSGTTILITGPNMTETVKAYATKAQMNDSTVASATYTIAYIPVATPQFNPGPGTYAGPQNVTISCSTTDATIRYTTDNTDPSETHGTQYTSGVSVPASMTLKAIAYKAGMADSAIASATYMITPLTPNNLSVSNETYNTLDVQWDSCNGATSYQVFRDDSSSGSFSKEVCNGGSTHFTDAGLNNGTTYYYKVQASNTSGVSPLSSAANRMTTASGQAQWARTVSTASGMCPFQGVAVDSSGNAYAVGYISGNTTYTFGAGVTAQGPFSGTQNAVLVKYDSSGTAQWARTPTAGSSYSTFYGVAVDSSDNIYVVGSIYETGSYTFATGVTAQGVYQYSNVVIVKYNSSGTAQWAQTITTGSGSSSFNSVAAYGTSAVYATGVINGASLFTFANGVTAQGASSSNNLLLVKYNSSGTAQWAATPSTAPDQGGFSSVAIDSSGNAYAAGIINGTGKYTFATGVTAQGYANQNVVLVKYNPSGVAQWAQTVTSASDGSTFTAVAIDGSGNLYAVGGINATAQFGFGNGVTAQGQQGQNALLVKYNSSGAAQWAQTTSSSPNTSYFWNIAIDGSNNIYVVGWIGAGMYGFGNGVATQAQGSALTNIVVVKYNTSGQAQWAQSAASGTAAARPYSVAADSSGNVFASGCIFGTGDCGFGNSTTVQGITSDFNALVVKYRY